METLKENVFDVEDNLSAELSMRIVLINLFGSLIYHDQGKIHEGLILAMSAYRNTVRLLFSLGIANPNDAFHTGQLVDVTGDCNTFVMEDMRVDTGSDKDYNDIIFQVRGATGSAISLDDVIASGKDWRNSDLEQALIAYNNCEFTVAANAQVDSLTAIDFIPGYFTVGESGQVNVHFLQGDDLIDGGEGVDKVNYFDSPNGVIVNIDESKGYESDRTLHESLFVIDVNPIEYYLNLEPDFQINSGTGKDDFNTIDILKNVQDIDGTPFDDILIRNSKDNYIQAFAGNDLLIGNAGNDKFDDGEASDFTNAGKGNDQLLGKAGDDILDDGAGNDSLSDNGNLLLGQYDILYGGYLTGGEGSDRIFGNEGNDELLGQVGNDYLEGGAGNDILIFYTGDCGVGVLPASEFIGLFQSISNRLFENEDGNDFSKGNEGNDILKSQKCSIRILLNKQKMSIFPATVAGKSMYLAKFSEQEHHYKRQFLPLTPIISNNKFSPALVSTCLLTVVLQQTCAACLFTEIYIIKGFQIRVAPVSTVATTESYKTQHQLASDKDAIASFIHLLTISTSLLEEVTRGMSFVAIMTKLSISALGAFKVCSASPDRAPPLLYKS